MLKISIPELFWIEIAKALPTVADGKISTLKSRVLTFNTEKTRYAVALLLVALVPIE